MKTGSPDSYGPYRVVRELGRGGMGRVFEVTGPGDRRAALKTLDRLAAADVELRQRFQREAEALARLRHPHVVRVHAAEAAGERPYLVQELLLGGDLEARLAGGALAIPEARELLRKLGQALAHCHEQGVLHRDLKPANVMFDDRGEPRLVDFGLSRIGGRELTATGAIVGTPHYMAPEQAQGGDAVDEQADVYGLGAVLFACLTGRAPFAGLRNVTAVLYALLKSPAPDVAALRPDAPPDLVQLCARALAKAPAERPRGARGFLAELERGVEARPAASWLAPGLVAAALVGAALAWRGASAPSEPTPASPQRVVTSAAAVDWDAVEAALAADRPADARRALGAEAPDAPDEATRWREARAATDLLSGDFEAARRGWAALARACQLEERRLALEAALLRGPGPGWRPRAMLRHDLTRATGGWLAQGEELLDRHARLAGDDGIPDPIAALGPRLLATLNRLFMSLQEGDPRLGEEGLSVPLLARAQQQLGREPLLPAEAVLLWVRNRDGWRLGKSVQHEVRDALFARAETRLWWGVWQAAWGHVTPEIAEALQVDVREQPRRPWLAAEMVAAAHCRVAEETTPRIAAALDAGDVATARALSTAAVRAARRGWELSSGRAGLVIAYGNERDQPLLIHLLYRGQAEAAGELVTGDPGGDSGKQVGWNRLFRAEVALLRGDLEAAADALRGLRIEGANGGEDWTDPYFTRAALALARGDPESARREIAAAPAHLHCRLPWRTPAATEALFAGEDVRAPLRFDRE